MAHPALNLLGQLALQVVGKKVQEKLDKKPEVQKAIKEVAAAVPEAPKSTAASAVTAIAAIVAAKYELSPEQAETYLPILKDLLTALFSLFTAYLLTWNKK